MVKITISVNWYLSSSADEINWFPFCGDRWTYSWGKDTMWSIRYRWKSFVCYSNSLLSYTFCILLTEIKYLMFVQYWSQCSQGAGRLRFSSKYLGVSVPNGGKLWKGFLKHLTNGFSQITLYSVFSNWKLESITIVI